MISIFILSMILAAEEDPMLQPGAEAPAFELKALDSEEVVNLDSMLKEHEMTFITFWTTHCPDCLASLANCHNLPDVFDSLEWDISVTSINYDRDEWDFVREFLKKEKISFPVLIDKKGKIAYKYGADIYNIAFFIIDKDKKIVWNYPDHPKKPKKALDTLVKSIGTKLFPDEKLTENTDSTLIDSSVIQDVQADSVEVETEE